MRIIALAIVLAAVAGCAMTQQDVERVAEATVAASEGLQETGALIPGTTGRLVETVGGIIGLIGAGLLPGWLLIKRPGDKSAKDIGPPKPPA